MQHGVMIRGVCYKFTGLIHDRGEGEWDVSVKRTTEKDRRWHQLKKDSMSDSRGEFCRTRDILSEVVLIQLCAKQENENDSVEEDVPDARDAEHHTDYVEEDVPDAREHHAFSVELVPHLRNGSLKICHINASLVLVLRAYPDVRTLVSHAKQQEAAGGVHSLVSEIETVLNSTQETDLVGLKRVLQERHPGEHAYDEGYAQEVLHQLLEDMIKAFTGDRRFGYIRVETEDKGNPPRCFKCSQLLASFCDNKSGKLTFLTFRPTQTGTVMLQQLIDKCEEEKRDCHVWTGCINCGEQQKVRAVSELKVPPNKFLMESVSGATNTVRGFEEDISWGLSTFEVSGVLHHDPVEEHFYASVRDGHTWWRIDDFCGDQNLSRKKYVKRRGVLETTGGVIQRLDKNVLFVLLEKRAEGEMEMEVEVSIFFSF